MPLPLAEARLEELEAILETISDPFVVLDSSLRAVYGNKAAHSAGFILAAGLSGYQLSPFSRVDLAKPIERARASKAPVRIEWSPPGEGLWFDVNVSATDELVSLAFRNVSIERRAREELQRSERRYRELVESSFDVVALLRANWTFIDVNRRWEELTGYTPDELIGTQLLRHLLTPASRQRLTEAIESCPGGDPMPSERFDVALIDKGGRRRRLEMSCRTIQEDRHERLIEIVGRDVTESRQLADRLEQSQKLEAVGRLAGGIAHDFNNVLLVVRGASGLLHDQLDDPDSLGLVKEIQRESERATSLVRQLLAFARRQVLQPATVDLNEVVGGLHGMLERLVGEAIDLSIELDPDPQYVSGDQSQIEQVLLNLVLNARDAIPGVGTITIETTGHSFAPGENPAWGDCKPGDYIELVVRDTGSGIEPHLHSTIFEPFFTSRGDENTGLGLATVYGIVTQMGGGLDLESAPGAGSTFTIYLPRLSDRRHLTTRRLAKAFPAQPAGTRPATILLVEDEEGPRLILEKILANLDYVVAAAPDGEAALDLLDTTRPPVDLLLTDVVMPGMSGPELAERFHERHPDVPVIFISGYNESTVALEARLSRGDALLEKPFTAADLAAEIQRSLQRGAARQAPPV
ncbi:MAG TPA: response regulator [Gaiellaceae bacterium]|nr:response regulator [Gaiellaceae bacterium]